MGNPVDDLKTHSDLVQRTNDLGDVEDKHDFFEETSCSWSEWFDLQIEKVDNVQVMREMSFFQLIPSLGRKLRISSKMNVEAKQSILSFQ